MTGLAPVVAQQVGQQPFQGGLYTKPNAGGPIVWKLFFYKKPGSVIWTVTGQFGDGAQAMDVNGSYYPASNKLRASMIEPDAFANALVPEMPTSVINIDGYWDGGPDPCFVIKPQGRAADRLKRYFASPDPGDPLFELSLERPAPQVAGTLIQGTGWLRVRGITYSRKTMLELVIEREVGAHREKAAIGRSPLLPLSEDGDYDIDLAKLVPLTIPASDADSVPVILVLYEVEESGYRALTSSRVRLAVAKPRQSVIVVDCSSSVKPSDLSSSRIQEGRPVSLNLSYKLKLDRLAETRVEQTVSIEPFGASGDANPMPRREFSSSTSPNGTPIPASQGQYQFTAPREGRYVLRYTISGSDVAPYNGSVIFDVDAADKQNASSGSEAAKPKPKIKLTGGVTVSPAKIKAGEKLQTTVSMTNPDTAEDVQVDCVLNFSKAVGGGTKLISRQTKKYAFTKGETRKSEPDLKLTEPGEYTLELLGVGDRVEDFRSEATIIVEPNDVPATTDSTSPPPANTSPKGGMKGKFGLMKKQPGKAPVAGEGPYGTWSGGTSESSFNATYIVKAPGEGNFTCQLGWEPPKQVYQAGEIIELKSHGTSSASGRDLPSLGVDAAWGVSGSAQIIEKKGSTYSGKGSDGKFYPSSDCTYRVKIGSGGTITLVAAYNGIAWGTQSMEAPCVYTYQWEADPTVQPGSGDAAKPKPGGSSEKPKPDPSTLTWNTPNDPDNVKQIEAWLDPMEITLVAGEPSKIVDVHIRNYRRDTAEDRVEVLFPQKTDNWASLPGRIVVNGGNGSYWPPNMATPEHVDGYFFSARRTARGGKFTVWWIVRQKGAGAVRIPLTVNVIARPGMVNGWNPPAVGPVTSAGGYKPLPEGAVPRGRVPQGEDEMRRKPVGPAETTVPDLATCATIRDMKAMLANASLTATFIGGANPPTKDLEFKLAGQSPVAGAKVSMGSAVTVAIYQQFDPGIPPGLPVHRSNNSGTPPMGVPATPIPGVATIPAGTTQPLPLPPAAHQQPGMAHANPPARPRVSDGMAGVPGAVILNSIPAGILSADAFGPAGVQLAAGEGIPAIYDVDASMVAPPACTKVMLVADKHQTTFTLHLNPAVKRFALQRIGARNGASLPTWTMTAYDAAGRTVGTAGEQRGRPAEWKLFEIKGAGITRITIATDNLVNGAPWSTWSSLPITGFIFDR